MDAQRLTDADFEPAVPDAGTDAGISETSFEGYPDWSSPAPPPLPAAASPGQEIADPSPYELSPDSFPDEQSTQFDAAEDEATPDPEPTTPAAWEHERDALLTQQAADREWITAMEAQDRERDLLLDEYQAQQEWDQFEWQYSQATAAAIARSQTMPDAHAKQFLQREFHRLNGIRDGKLQEISQARVEQVQSVLAHHPTIRNDFYTMIITDYGLPEEARAELARYDPNQLDHYLPAIQRHYTDLAHVRTSNVQLKRELEAQKRIASGADAMGGTRGGGGRHDPRLDPTHADYDPYLAYEPAGRWTTLR